MEQYIKSTERVGAPYWYVDQKKHSVRQNGFPEHEYSAEFNDVYCDSINVNGDDISSEISDMAGDITTLTNAINGIVESGSNANGHYTKFSNGFMICMKNEMDISHTGTSTLGGASVHYGSATWTFPVAFTTPITCIATARDSGSGVFGAEIDGDMETTGVKITVYGGNTSYKANVVAFGMWK